MKKQLAILFFLTAILSIGVVIVAQDNPQCEIDSSDIITVVDTTCNHIGQDEVCYGNFDVNVVPQDTAPDLSFDEPGDLASLGFVRSLFLSAFEPDKDIWGIAQMRLLAATQTGTQDVTLLLFGDVEVKTDVAEETEMQVVVGRSGGNIRSTPSANGTLLASASPLTILTAVGRLEDSSWVRVRILNDASVGWISTDVILPNDEDESYDLLAVQNRSDPYFGSMQAFYYQSGTSPSCSNAMVDGLIIQTPSGNARVTLLINEVSIELIGGENGATAFVEANPENGMSVSVIDGTAVVGSGGTSYFVNATTSTNIPMSDDMKPAGVPTVPELYDVEEMSALVLLSVVRDPSIPITADGAAGGSGSGGTGGGRGNSNANGNANSNANGNANGQGNSNGRANGRGR